MSDPSTPAAAWRAHPAYGVRPRLELTNDGLNCRRLVVVAAHPDDESLGAGGLIATAADAGLSVYVVLLTAGEASPHAPPDSSRHALATMRLAEMENALHRLAPDNFLVFLGAPDGAVADSEEQIGRSLAELVGDGRTTLLAAPWRGDPHADHAAAGRAAAVAALATGARLVEYPLLAWARTDPDEFAWEHVVGLDLDEERQERKAAAIRAHVSQVRAARDALATSGTGPPLPGRVLAHFAGPHEHFVETPVCDLATVPPELAETSEGARVEPGLNRQPDRRVDR